MLIAAALGIVSYVEGCCEGERAGEVSGLCEWIGERAVAEESGGGIGETE